MSAEDVRAVPADTAVGGLMVDEVRNGASTSTFPHQQIIGDHTLQSHLALFVDSPPC